MIFRQAQFKRRAQHARAFNAADRADTNRNAFAWNKSAGWRKDAFHPCARIWCAADNLNRLAIASVHHAHAQAIRIGVLFG